MQKNFIFVLLSAVLLIQQTLGETEWSPNGKAFRDAAIEEFAVLSEEPLFLGKKLLKDIYADKLDNPSVKRILYGALRDLEDIECAEPSSQMSVFLRLYIIFDVATGSIAKNTEDKETILAIKKAFEKHNVYDVSKEFHQKFYEFLEWFTLEFEAKSYTLNSEDQLRLEEFIELCHEFKDKTNPNKKESAKEALLVKLL